MFFMTGSKSGLLWRGVQIASFSIFLLILMWLCYRIGLRHGEGKTPSPEVLTEIHTDTVTVTQTVTRPEPVWIHTERRDTLTIPVERLVYLEGDTVAVEMPVERKDYRVEVQTDSVSGEILASVSGINVSLDTLRYRLEVPRETITVTNTVTRQKRWGFSVGPAVGVGYNGTRIGPYVGIGVQWGYQF